MRAKGCALQGVGWKVRGAVGKLTGSRGVCRGWHALRTRVRCVLMRMGRGCLLGMSVWGRRIKFYRTGKLFGLWKRWVVC